MFTSALQQLLQQAFKANFFVDNLYLDSLDRYTLPRKLYRYSQKNKRQIKPTRLQPRKPRAQQPRKTTIGKALRKIFSGKGLYKSTSRKKILKARRARRSRFSLERKGPIALGCKIDQSIIVVFIVTYLQFAPSIRSGATSELQSY